MVSYLNMGLIFLMMLVFLVLRKVAQAMKQEGIKRLFNLHMLEDSQILQL